MDTKENDVEEVPDKEFRMITTKITQRRQSDSKKEVSLIHENRIPRAEENSKCNYAWDGELNKPIENLSGKPENGPCPNLRVRDGR